MQSADRALFPAQQGRGIGRGPAGLRRRASGLTRTFSPGASLSRQMVSPLISDRSAIQQQSASAAIPRASDGPPGAGAKAATALPDNRCEQTFYQPQRKYSVMKQ